MSARNLDRKAVVDAGVLLVQRQGFAALGIRPLAAALEVTPMALYRHVSDGDALLGSVVESLTESLPLLEKAKPGRVSLGSWARQMREALAATPGFAHHLMLHWFELPAMLQQIEDLLEAVETLGLKGFEAVAAANALFTFVLMRVQLEESLRKGSAMTRKLSGLARAKKSLPRLAAHAREYEVAKIDEHFNYGLELLLDGLLQRKRK